MSASGVEETALVVGDGNFFPRINIPDCMDGFTLCTWAEPDFAGKLAFLRCTQDQALPLFLQDTFTEESGVKWNIRNIEASHSPWAGKPEETVRILKEWAQDFEDKA